MSRFLRLPLRQVPPGARLPRVHKLISYKLTKYYNFIKYYKLSTPISTLKGM